MSMLSVVLAFAFVLFGAICVFRLVRFEAARSASVLSSYVDWSSLTARIGRTLNAVPPSTELRAGHPSDTAHLDQNRRTPNRQSQT